jgi:hypothetical protein
MDGGQIRIALESSSGVSSRCDVGLSQSSDLERGNNAFKKGGVLNQNGLLNKKVAIHISFWNIHKSAKTEG